MDLGLSKKIWLGRGVKVVIFALLALAIYHQIFYRSDSAELLHTFRQHLNGSFWILLTFVISLMFVNWGLETRKWQLLMTKVAPLPFLKAFSAIFSGVTLALFTPNRIGEYGGRVVILPPEKRLSAVAVTLVGSLSQILANGLLSLVGFGIFSWLFLSPLNGWVQVGLVVSVVLLAVGYVFYFRTKWLTHKAMHQVFLKKIHPYIEPLALFSVKELAHILGISFARNLVFTVQYLALLWAFGIDVGLGTAWVAINTVFFIQTLIPTFAIIELGVRGNVALYVLGFLTAHPLSILAATFALWAINLMVPALIGLVLVIRDW